MDNMPQIKLTEYLENLEVKNKSTSGRGILSTSKSKIPLGYCQCGCGGKTNIIKGSWKKYGYVKGQPNKYIKGHFRKGKTKYIDMSHIKKLCECGCGQLFNKYDNKGRKRKYIYGHKKLKQKLKHPLKPQLCACGCGELTSGKWISNKKKYPKYINFHHSWNKGLTKETSEKVRNYGIKITNNKERARKLSKSLKGRMVTWQEKISKNHADVSGKNNPMYGKKRTKEVRKRISKKLKEIYKDKNSIFNQKEYKEKVLKASLKGLMKKPTKLENTFIKFIKKYNLPYRYVGDGEILIGYKNPDFININGEKIAIEVFNDYWKIKRFGSVENYKKVREKYFRKYGWKTIFFHEKEYKNEKSMLNKLKNG